MHTYIVHSNTHTHTSTLNGRECVNEWVYVIAYVCLHLRLNDRLALCVCGVLFVCFLNGRTLSYGCLRRNSQKFAWHQHQHAYRESRARIARRTVADGVAWLVGRRRWWPVSLIERVVSTATAAHRRRPTPPPHTWLTCRNEYYWHLYGVCVHVCVWIPTPKVLDLSA